MEYICNIKINIIGNETITYNNNNYQLKGDKQKIDEKKPKQSKPHSKPKKKEKSLTELKRNSVITSIWVQI